MTNDELRKACELAGLEWLRHLGVWVTPDVAWTYPPSDPALPAYVASLLVAKVVVAGQHFRLFEQLAEAMPDHPMCVATDEQRIRAAVAALEESE